MSGCQLLILKTIFSCYFVSFSTSLPSLATETLAFEETQTEEYTNTFNGDNNQTFIDNCGDEEWSCHQEGKRKWIFSSSSVYNVKCFIQSIDDYALKGLNFLC